MGLRFQRRIKVLPGLRINLSKSGVGFSVGGRGAHIGITARGQRYTSIGMPGTGLSWREYQNRPAARRCDLCAPGHLHIPPAIAILLLIAAAIIVLLLLARKDADEILIEEENGRIRAEVTRYGRRIISVTLAVRQTVDPIPERPKNPICFLKVIPSIQADAPPDVLKLNATVIDPDVIKELRVGEGTLEFGDSPYDPFLARIPIRQVLYSEVIIHDFTLGYGQVLVDYLADRS